MKRNALPSAMLALLCLGYLAFIAATKAQLPERVAMHFGLGGHADGWMSRNEAVAFFLGMGWGVAALFLLLSVAMNWMPNGTFNLPNRDYWLAPERRFETIGLLSRQLIWLGCPMVLFLSGIYGLTIIANRAAPVQLPMHLLLLLVAGFLLMIGIWCVSFYRHFGKRQG